MYLRVVGALEEVQHAARDGEAAADVDLRESNRSTFIPVHCQPLSPLRANEMPLLRTAARLLPSDE